MHWPRRLSLALALLAGLAAAVWLVWAIGFDAVFAAIARAGIDGLVLLCLYALVLLLILALAWFFLFPRGRRPAVADLYLARLVRDSITDLSPFSAIGGMAAAARVMVLRGMTAGQAAAASAADATTEAMAQAAFLAFGIAVAVMDWSGGAAADTLLRVMLTALLLAVPGIAALVLLQKKGAGFAEKMLARFFPRGSEGGTFRQAIHELYDSPSRLAASAAWHLFGWIASGGSTWLGFHLVGGNINLLDAVALEALICTLRSIAAFVPAAVGVQEGGYALLAQLFGLPPEMGLAVSLLKRAREIVLGVPALLYWQAVEGRRALADG